MNWFFAVLFLFQGQPKIKNVFKNAGYAAVVNGIIAVSSSTDGVLIYDADLQPKTKLIAGKHAYVYPFDKTILIISADDNQPSFLLHDGQKKEDVGYFKPRSVATDRASMVFFPVIDSKGSVLVNEYVNWGIHDPLVQKFTFSNGLVERKGEPFLNPPQGLKRLSRTFKGIWVFQNRKKDVEILLQTDPFVFREDEGQYKELDLPDFRYRTDQIPKTDRIFTYKDWVKYRYDFYLSTSLIWGAFRYKDGYVVCYSVGQAWGGPYRLAFFNQNWVRYGRSQVIHGRLIGLIHGRGIILTDPDDANYSQLKKVDLMP